MTEQRAKAIVRAIGNLMMLAFGLAATGAVVVVFVGIALYDWRWAIGLAVACALYVGLIRAVIAVWEWATGL